MVQINFPVPTWEVPKTAFCLVECSSSLEAEEVTIFINRRSAIEAEASISGSWRIKFGLGKRQFVCFELHPTKPTALEVFCELLGVQYVGREILHETNNIVWYLLQLAGWDDRLK